MDDGVAVTLIDALIADGLAGQGEHDLVDGLCRRLVAAGIPLTRAVAGSDVLHPEYESRLVRWHRGEGIERRELRREIDPDDSGDWRRDPFSRLFELRMPRFRQRLGSDLPPGEYPVLDNIKQLGSTDYTAFFVPLGGISAFGSVNHVMFSWAIDRPEGFSDAELRLLERIAPTFALVFAGAAHVDIARHLMSLYLGGDAANRVLSGQVERGRAETIRAVIWYSDLADFTRIADEVERDQLLALLNDYAECLVDVVTDHGGHVLKFIGDGLLAIFPDEDATRASARALDATAAAERRIAVLSERRARQAQRITDFYLALHQGELLYGNFGSRRRLDFTVLGPAVNEASRIVALCRSLDQRVIVSSAFAEATGPRRSTLVSLGRYALRGVTRPQELFTIDRTQS